MKNGFNALSIDAKFRRARFMIWRTRVINCSWLVAAALLALVLMRVVDSSPQGLRDPAIVAKLLALQRADPWSVEEERLEAVIADTRRRYAQFRRHQPFYSQAVVDQTRENMVRYIKQGIAPSVALARAVEEAERGGQLPIASAE